MACSAAWPALLLLCSLPGAASHPATTHYLQTRRRASRARLGWTAACCAAARCSTWTQRSGRRCTSDVPVRLNHAGLEEGARPTPCRLAASRCLLPAPAPAGGGDSVLTLRLELEAAPADCVGEWGLAGEEGSVGRVRAQRTHCLFLLLPPPPSAGVQVEVKGLLGGHSGLNIDEGRGAVGGCVARTWGVARPCRAHRELVPDCPSAASLDPAVPQATRCRWPRRLRTQSSAKSLAPSSPRWQAATSATPSRASAPRCWRYLLLRWLPSRQLWPPAPPRTSRSTG